MAEDSGKYKDYIQCIMRLKLDHIFFLQKDLH